MYIYFQFFHSSLLVFPTIELSISSINCCLAFVSFFVCTTEAND